MSRSVSLDHVQPATGASQVAETTVLERIAFVVLVTLLTARLVVSESYQAIEISFLGALGAEGGATPLLTAWIDGFLLLASLPAWWRVRLSRGNALWCAALLLLLGGVVISMVVSFDKRSAMTASTDLVAILVAGVALVHLMRSAWMRVLLLAAIVSAGTAFAVECWWQVYVWFPDLRAQWALQKPQLEARGYTGAMLENFDRRLRAGEASGYLALSNIAGSCLMAWALMVVGTVVGVVRTRNRPESRSALLVVLVVILVVMIGGVWFTNSLGVRLSLIVGLAALLIIWRAGGALQRRPIRAAVIALVGYFVLLGGLLTVGAIRGTLPTTSLAFRWFYWSAAADAIAAHPWTGVGRENFRSAYLLYKVAESTEDVQNPHNIWIALLVELGPAGLAGGVLAVGLVLVALLRPGPDAHPSPSRSGWLWVPAVAVPALMLAWGDRVTFGQPETLPATLMQWCVEFLAIWVAAFVVAVGVGWRLVAERSGWEWLRRAIVAALLGVLVHNLVSFSLLNPAGLSLVVLLSALAWPRPPTSGPSPNARRDGRPYIAFAVICGSLLLHGLISLWPMTRAAFREQQTRLLLERAIRSGSVYGAQPILRSASLAADGDVFDSDRAIRSSMVAVQLASAPELAAEHRLELLGLATELGELALLRNPANLGAVRLLARIAEQREEPLYDTNQPGAAVQALSDAAEHWQSAVALYPTNPDLRRQAGRVAYLHWRQTGLSESALQARTALRQALTLDRKRPAGDVVRFPDSVLNAIERMLEELPPDE